jgi:ABC-type glutathione transport system ATPase component
MRPEKGEIRYRGINIFPRTENRYQFGAEIQMIFQGGSASLDPAMTASKSVAEALGARRSPVSPDAGKAIVEKLFVQVGLPISLADRYPSALSGGQKQRVAIARVLAADPALLVLDEPTSALDVLTQTRTLSLLKQVQCERHISMLLITHDVETALAYCDRIALLHNGTIVEQGPSQQILHSPVHPATKELLTDCRIL